MGVAGITVEGRRHKVEPRVDVMVTARVPREVKQKGDLVLKRIGATPTDLVNASYEYVLKHGELPGITDAFADLKPGKRKLTSVQKEQLRKALRSTTFKMPDSWYGKTYKELREEAMRERYPDRFDG